MESSLPQSEHKGKMSLEPNISQHLSTDGHRRSHRPAFGPGLFTKGVGSAFQPQRLLMLTLGLVNAVLLIVAVVVGIYCAKAKDLQIPDSAAAPLTVELNFLRNQSGILRAKVEAQGALVRERSNHLEIKLQVKQQKIVTDVLQRQIETLQTKQTKLKSNKTALEENCGRCQTGWILLKSSCYYLSHRLSNSKKNWPDSRADCIERGGDLLVINNLEEQMLLNYNFPQLMRSSSSSSSSVGAWWQNGFWIGLTDVVMRGTWVWVNNVTEVENMNWRIGQPQQSGPQSGNCAAYCYADTRRTWYNGNCSDHQFNWICEMEPK